MVCKKMPLQQIFFFCVTFLYHTKWILNIKTFLDEFSKKIDKD